ncbi:MAG TPA: winged helix-turn-helix domain-containing protein [Terriglobales bacterium]|nr:winged helix-turn-helix domain-containing protein [Terriglobales bacterium]
MLFNGSASGVGGAAGRVWRFAGREFDESRLELRVDGKPVELELKPMEVLIQLLHRAGEVLSKDELLEAVWPGLSVVEGSLSTAVYKLRKVLGDEDSQIIVTVPRVGYRLEGASVSCATVSSLLSAESLSIAVGHAAPGRPHWLLTRRLGASPKNEVWLAEHPKTGEQRVFKFAEPDHLKALKREVTVFRFLGESLGERPDFVRIFEWSFDKEPYFIESEYGGLDLASWAAQGGLNKMCADDRAGMVASIADTVAAAHKAGVLHKDLKPGNILVSNAPDRGRSIKLADFGSASLVEPSRLKALGITGLGFTQTGVAASPSLTGTLMYLAPEVLVGKPPTALSDVYALGIILYQTIIGDFSKPLAVGWESGIDDSLLRDDIAAAVTGDPARRTGSASELAQRLRTLEQRRIEHGRREDARQDAHLAERRRTEAHARRPWIAAVTVVLAASLVLAFSLYTRFFSRNTQPVILAVLPFQNAAGDPSLDFLRLALSDEVASTLSYKRSLSLLPFSATSKYTDANLDLRKAGREMGATRIVTGHFLKNRDQLQVTLEATDVEQNRLLWRDTLEAPPENLIALERQIIAATREGLASTLGPSSFDADTAARPQNEEGYNLYLHSIAMPADPVPNKDAIAMLEKAVALDPKHAPAWRALSLRYYYDAHYGAGGSAMLKRSEAAAERARSLDPNFILADTQLVSIHLEGGELKKAYVEAEDLVRRRPDNAEAHFTLSAVLRFAGLTDEAAAECEKARALEPHNRGWRSCYVVFALRGDYDRALEYIRLDDPGSEYARAQLVHLLLYEGKPKEAAEVPSGHTSWWASFRMAQACAARKPLAEITAMSALVQPQDDSESNFWFSADLAYCRQTDAALDLLARAIKGNYCSYPAMDIGPFFASMKDMPEFVRLRAAGIACQQDFIAARARTQARTQP